MNIKKIIKSQKIRHRIISLFKWIPDELMLKFQYRIILGRWPDLKKPKRFSEIIQVYKIKYRNDAVLRCVDKLEVRKFVSDKLKSSENLTELYQVVKNANDIDLGSLPDKFVIKSTSGGNGDNVLIVTEKSEFDLQSVKTKLNGWLKKNYSNVSREWAYSQVASNPKLIIEEYLEIKSENGLEDYKFLCFKGVMKVLWVDKDRFADHKRAFWDGELKFLKNVESDYPTFDEDPGLPEEIMDMKRIAEKLAEDFPFVRVDLYNVKGKIYFGELTFYPWSGYVQFKPDEFDYKLGSYFKL